MTASVILAWICSRIAALPAGSGCTMLAQGSSIIDPKSSSISIGL
jgi:hypothetical protein